MARSRRRALALGALRSLNQTVVSGVLRWFVKLIGGFEHNPNAVGFKSIGAKYSHWSKRFAFECERG